MAERARVAASPWRCRVDRETGSVLLLMPVAVLIVVLLASISVDRAIVVAAQRDLVATAEAAAADASAVGLDPDALRRTGTLRYDATRIDAAVTAAVRHADGQVSASWSVRDGAVHVHLIRTVDLLFTPGIPGADDQVVVDATASADLVLR